MDKAIAMTNRKDRRATEAVIARHLVRDRNIGELVELAAVGLRGNPALAGTTFAERKAVVRNLIARGDAEFAPAEPYGTIGIDLVEPALRLPLLNEDFADALKRVRRNDRGGRHG